MFRSYLCHNATSWKVAGLIPDGVIGTFHWHNPSGRTMALRLTQPLTEMSTRNVSWGGKSGRCYAPDNLTTFMSQGIRIIQSNIIFIVKIYVCKTTCFSSAEPSSGLYRRTDPNLIFVQFWSQEFTVLKYIAELKLLELKWISVYCNKLKYCIFTMLLNAK